VLLERIGFFDFFRKETYSSQYTINNWLGIAGAFTSNIFVNNIFGYYSVIVSLAVCVVVIPFSGENHFTRAITFSIYSVFMMVILSSGTGLVRIFCREGYDINKGKRSSRGFSGNVFYKFMGNVGASIFIVLMFTLTSFLTF